MKKKNTGEENHLESLLSPAAKGKKRLRLVITLLVLLLLAGGTGYFFLRDGAGGKEGPGFETVRLTRGDLQSTIASTGTVEALNTVELGAEISGKIESLFVDFNDPVKKGQLLVELDPQQQKAAVSEAKARVLASRAGQAESKAALLEANQTLDRVKALVERGLTSKKDLESAQASAARAKASLASAKANAALSQAAYEAAVTKLSKTEIVSPIDGVVLSREVEVGQAINAGMQTPVLFTLAEDLRQMHLSSMVDEADIGMVKEGQEATFTVDAFPDKVFSSAVTSVRNVPVTEQNVVAYEVLLTVDNSQLLLKPGMTATVDIITEAQKDVLIVPNKALRFKPPSEASERRRRGPPMPLLGAGKNREKSNEKEQKSGRKMGGMGQMGTDEGLLWILEGGAPSPVKVKKLATDGSSTAVEGEALSEGMKVVVDMAVAAGEAS